MTVNATSADALRDELGRLLRTAAPTADERRSVSDYFKELLNGLVRVTGATGGAVWLPRIDGREWSPVVTVQSVERNGAVRQALREETLAAGTTSVRRPSNGEHPNLLLSALRHRGTVIGLFEIELRDNVPHGADDGYSQVAEELSSLAGRFLDRTLQSPSESPEFSNEFASFCERLHATVRTADAAGVVVNESRLLLPVDRVSFVSWRGRTARVEAVSGQGRIDRRSEIVRTLGELADSVIRSGRSRTYDDSNREEASPEFERALAEFVRAGGARTLHVEPIREPSPGDGNPGRIVGCLVAECTTETVFDAHFESRVTSVSRHAAISWTNARRWETLPLAGLLRVIGRGVSWCRWKRPVLTTAVVLALGLVVWALVALPWEFRIEADGRLLPESRSNVYAPSNSEVVEVLVTSGTAVSRGQELVRLVDEELRTALLEVRSTLVERRKEEIALSARVDAAVAEGDRVAETRLRGEVERAAIEIAALEERRERLLEREARLVVRSPIDGVVASFDPGQRLRNRPVNRGDRLLEIADDRGRWMLELDVPERHMGHLHAAVDRGETELGVDFLLSTDPSRTLHGTTRRRDWAMRTEPSRNGEPVVPVIVSVTLPPEVRKRAGAEVRARVDCGRATLGYVLFGDVVDFVRKWILF